MTELIFVDNAPEEYTLPAYETPGDILFYVRILDIDAPNHYYRYEIEVPDYDTDSGILWLNEGIGIDYWLRTEFDFEREGVYLLKGVHGMYFKGTWGFDDDDEEWYYEELIEINLNYLKKEI